MKAKPTHIFLGVSILQTTALTLMMTTSACGTGFMQQAKDDASTTANSSVNAKEDSDGVATASVTANSTTTQLIKTSDTGSLAGSSLSIPPGSLAINVTISIQEASSLANSNSTEVLGVSNTFTAAGPAIVFKPSSSTEALVAMTLSIPISSTSLTADTFELDASSANLAIVFLATSFRDGVAQNFMGLMPASELTVAAKAVSFKTTRFGTFQLIRTATKIEAPVQVATAQTFAAKPSASFPHLGLWRSGCVESTEQVGTNTVTDYERTEFLINRDSLFVRSVSFADADCRNILDSIGMTADYALPGDSTTVPGARNFDAKITKVTLRFHTPARILVANRESFCGLKDWVLNADRDVSSAACGGDNSSSSGVPKAGKSIFTLMKVSGDTMLLGENDGDTAETRATILESDQKALTRVR